MLFVMRRRGPQPRLDIMVIARELAQFQPADASLKVLFDWSELDSWPFEAPSLVTSVQSWKETVPSISCAGDRSRSKNGPVTPRSSRLCCVHATLRSDRSYRPITTARSFGSSRNRSVKGNPIAVIRDAFSAVQRFRRHFAECLLIVVREATHVAETAGECDVGDGFVEARFRQHLPRVPQSLPLQETHWGIAAEPFEGMKNTAGACVRCTATSPSIETGWFQWASI